MSGLAAHCEVKLHGFRRTQDGVVVSFVVHPAEVPKMLALDDLGTRYILALAPIDDNEEPRDPPTATAESRPPDTAAFAPQADSGPGGAIHQKDPWRSAVARARYDALSPEEQAVARAAILADDPQFQGWCGERTPEAAKAHIRETCGVFSCKEFLTDRGALEKFLNMEIEFVQDTAGRLAERRG